MNKRRSKKLPKLKVPSHTSSQLSDESQESQEQTTPVQSLPLNRAYIEIPDLPLDEPSPPPVEYSFTFPTNQTFEPQGTSTPKPEDYVSFGSFQHWTPPRPDFTSFTLDSAGSYSEIFDPLLPFTEVDEYGWVTAESDCTPVTHPVQVVVPPSPETPCDIFRRTPEVEKRLPYEDPKERERADDRQIKLMLWGLQMRHQDMPLDERYESIINTSPNDIRDVHIREKFRKEYAEKKRMVQDEIDRQRFEEALQRLPENERQRLECLKRLLLQLKSKKKLALKKLQWAEQHYIIEATSVKRHIEQLESAKKRENKVRQDFKEMRREYSNRELVTEYKKILKVKRNYRETLLRERHRILEKKDKFLCELNAAKAGLENNKAYLDSMKEKSEWWLQELRDRMKHKTESLKLTKQLLDKEQAKTIKLKEEIQKTEEVATDVRLQVDEILHSVKTLAEVVLDLKRKYNEKLPAEDAAASDQPMSASKKKLVSEIHFFHKAIEEEKGLIDDALRLLYEEIMKYNWIIHYGLKRGLGLRLPPPETSYNA